MPKYYFVKTIILEEFDAVDDEKARTIVKCFQERDLERNPSEVNKKVKYSLNKCMKSGEETTLKCDTE